MSEDIQWYVSQGEQQFGPYTGEQLVEFSTAGNITPEAMVWAEGMPEWLPASQIPGLFPNGVPPQPAPAAITQTAPAFGSKPTSALGLHTPLGVDDPYPSSGIKAANFVLWLGLFLGGISLMLIGLLMLGSAATAAAKQTTNGSEITEAQVGMAGFASIIFIAGIFVNLASTIPMYIFLYRAWSCLKPGGFARTTPGAAIGFLFVPFFNMYWIFQAFLGLAQDWNKTVATYSDLKAAPRMPEGLFLTFCIGCFIPPVAFIMIFIVMSRICNGINFFAFRPKPGQYSAFGAKPGGALAIR